MASADVRAAVYDYFAPPAVAILNTLYKAEPIFASGNDWQLDSGVGFGAMGDLHSSDESEARIAFGGATSGIKSITYNVAIVLLYRYVITNNISDNGPDEWTDGLDALIDGVKARLRADRNLGTGESGVVWQAGEGNNTSEPDIKVTRDLPKLTPNKVEAWQVVEFVVIENIES